MPTQEQALWCSEAATEPNPPYREYDKENCQDGDKYREGDALNFAVGQGTITVSPLQLAAAYGWRMAARFSSPRIGKAIIRPDGTLLKTIKAPSPKLPVPANVLEYEKQALTRVVSDPAGTASRAFAGFPTSQYTVGGKTGTAEVQAMNTDGLPAVRQILRRHMGSQRSSTNPHDQFATAGPALLNGALPTDLPNLLPSGTWGASPSAAHLGTGEPAAAASRAEILATKPDTRSTGVNRWRKVGKDGWSKQIGSESQYGEDDQIHGKCGAGSCSDDKWAEARLPTFFS